MAPRTFGTWVAAVVAVAVIGVAMTDISAQRGGGGSTGTGGYSLPSGPPAMRYGRLDSLAESFKMTREQKDATKSAIDAAHKAAGPIRDGLRTTRAAISTAVTQRKPQAEIDAAVDAYAEHATAMAELEMKTLAEVLRGLTPEQRQNSAASQQAFFMFRGIFLDERRWNFIADGFYGY